MTAPLALLDTAVRPEWIDLNDHMNVAYYVLAFDLATDALFDRLDIGRCHVAEDRQSMFALEVHVRYTAELCLGDRLRVTCQLLDADEKRLHFFHRMVRSDGVAAATSEWLALHVALGSRKATPFPAAVRTRIAALAAAQATLPMPAEAGRTIGIRRPPG